MTIGIACLLASGVFFCFAWLEMKHEDEWVEVEPEPEDQPELPHQAFPLVLPAHSGWGTCLDLASTRVFYRPIIPDRIIDVT